MGIFGAFSSSPKAVSGFAQKPGSQRCFCLKKSRFRHSLPVNRKPDAGEAR
jgi:hypothetical protein